MLQTPLDQEVDSIEKATNLSKHRRGGSQATLEVLTKFPDIFTPKKSRFTELTANKKQSQASLFATIAPRKWSREDIDDELPIARAGEAAFNRLNLDLMV